MPRYLLVCSTQALDSFSRRFGTNWRECVVLVASTLHGILACERARVPYTTLDQYSSRDEIINLGWRNYSSLTQFCERWDLAAQSFSPTLKNRGIKPFRFGYFDLKILIDSVSIKILMLKNFIRHAKGQEIFYLLEADQRIVSGEFLRPRNDVNMFSVLLATVLKGEPNLCPLPEPRARDQLGLRARLRPWFTSVRTRLSRTRDTLRSLQLFRRNLATEGYLCLSYGHDIKYLIPQLAKRHLRLVSLPEPIADVRSDPKAINDCEQLWRKLLTEDEFSLFFSYQGINYYRLVRASLEEYIKLVLPRAISNFDYLRSAPFPCSIKFILTGSINLGLVNRCRMLASQARGASLVTYTEGAGYGSIITPIYDFTEMQDGDVMLCYGQGNLEYYRDLGTVSRAIIPVGSAHQESIRKKVFGNIFPTAIRTVMYVGTNVQDNVMHCPNNGLVSTIYHSTQVKMFRMLASLPSDRRVVVKPNPSDAFTPEFLQMEEFKRIKLETRRFEKVIGGVDLFILDFPSTVLLSCIATRAYVFVLAELGVTGFTQKQRERLEKRAYLFDEFSSLESAVSEIMLSTVNFPARLDDSYMLAYSINNIDKSSAEYAADVLAELPEARL